MIPALIIVQAIAWVIVLGVVVRLALTRDATPAARPHLWIVPADTSTSAVRAIKDIGPYDWAADVDGAA